MGATCSGSWQHRERVPSQYHVPSCPAQLLQTEPVASLRKSVQVMFGLPLSLLSSVFLRYRLSQRTLPCHGVPEAGQHSFVICLQ